jgi:hypothetical protein
MWLLRPSHRAHKKLKWFKKSVKGDSASFEYEGNDSTTQNADAATLEA